MDGFLVIPCLLAVCMLFLIENWINQTFVIEIWINQIS